MTAVRTLPTGLVTSAAPDPDLVAVLRDLFADYRANRSTPTESVDLDRTLWARLDQLGLTRLTAAEERGGSSGTWVDSAALLALAAGAAAPVPLAENDLLAGWLLDVAGLPDDGQLRTVCRPDPSGVARRVPWGRDADRVVALWSSGDDLLVADVPRGRFEVEERRDLAGFPCDTVIFDLGDLRSGMPVDRSVSEQLRLRGALARSVQAVGAMERVVDVVVAHARDRTQFGRPIGRFQAVQHLVSDLAGETALARAAVDAAVARATAGDWQDPGMLFSVAVAASCVGHSSSVVVRGAHQVLGAIGTTLEHELHSLTTPILAWRSDFGSVHEWDETLMRLAVAAGTAGVWPLVTATHTGGRP